MSHLLVLLQLLKLARQNPRFVLCTVLFKLHLWDYPVEKIYAWFALGEIPSNGLYMLLRPEQVPEFLALHERIKSFVENGEENIPLSLLVHLSRIMIRNPLRFHFMIHQIDALITKDLESGILRRSKNVISRID